MPLGEMLLLWLLSRDTEDDERVKVGAENAPSCAVLLALVGEPRPSEDTSPLRDAIDERFLSLYIACPPIIGALGDVGSINVPYGEPFIAFLIEINDEPSPLFLVSLALLGDEGLQGMLYVAVATSTVEAPTIKVGVIRKLNNTTLARKEMTILRLVAKPLRILSEYLMTMAVISPPNT